MRKSLLSLCSAADVNGFSVIKKRLIKQQKFEIGYRYLKFALLSGSAGRKIYKELAMLTVKNSPCYGHFFTVCKFLEISKPVDLKG